MICTSQVRWIPSLSSVFKVLSAHQITRHVTLSERPGVRLEIWLAITADCVQGVSKVNSEVLMQLWSCLTTQASLNAIGHKLPWYTRQEAAQPSGWNTIQWHDEERNFIDTLFSAPRHSSRVSLPVPTCLYTSLHFIASQAEPRPQQRVSGRCFIIHTSRTSSRQHELQQNCSWVHEHPWTLTLSRSRSLNNKSKTCFGPAHLNSSCDRSLDTQLDLHSISSQTLML